jgi:RNA polymerase sigma factor (sigma-70 family)
MSFTLTLKSILLNQHSNESLMFRYAVSGDRALLTRLYDACGNDLYHFILTLSDPTLAKDICQKTWIKVIEKKHLYKDSGQFKAWLFTLARNQLMDEYRKIKSTNNEIEIIVDDSQNIQLDTDISLVFDQALLVLPFEQREAFCLQQEGFSIVDIATITHSNSETTRATLCQA